MAICAYVDYVDGLPRVFQEEYEVYPDCTAYVLMNKDETEAAWGFWPSWSVEQGSSIGLEIFLAWAVAFGFRILRKLIEDANF